MEAKELRIGNIVVSIDEKPIAITGIFKQGVHDEDFNGYGFNEIKPVLLDEKTLLSLGFEHHFDRVEEINYYCIKDFVIEKDFFCFGYAEPIVYDLLRVNTKNPLKYVHQLQNLYFALTGEDILNT